MPSFRPPRFLSTGIAAILLFCLWNPAARAYDNLWEYEQDLIKYHDTDYPSDVQAVDRKAEAYIARRAAAGGGKLALVLDIDDTSLSDWNELTKDLDFGYNAELFNRWAARAEAPVIAPTLELFRQARAAGVSVFFVSGRPDILLAATAANLHKAGYAGWSGLELKPATYHAPAGVPSKTAAFKTRCRMGIEAKGYVIIANVGDQGSDLAGGHAEQTFKLPNPFYKIP